MFKSYFELAKAVGLILIVVVIGIGFIISPLIVMEKFYPEQTWIPWLMILTSLIGFPAILIFAVLGADKITKKIYCKTPKDEVMTEIEADLTRQWYHENVSVHRPHGWMADDKDGNPMSVAELLIRFAKWYKSEHLKQKI